MPIVRSSCLMIAPLHWICLSCLCVYMGGSTVYGTSSVLCFFCKHTLVGNRWNQTKFDLVEACICWYRVLPWDLNVEWWFEVSLVCHVLNLAWQCHLHVCVCVDYCCKAYLALLTCSNCPQTGIIPKPFSSQPASMLMKVGSNQFLLSVTFQILLCHKIFWCSISYWG